MNTSINQITRLTLVNTSIKTLATGVLTVALITPLLALLLSDCFTVCVPAPKLSLDRLIIKNLLD